MGTPKPPAPKTIKSYSTGVKERAAEARAQRPGMPNIARASEEYKAGRDRPMTLSQISEAQKAVDHGEAKEAGLSLETVAGLHAIKQFADQQRSTMETPKTATPDTAAVKPVEAPKK